tara:strand:+ start:18841 stop:19656 length:816 start_codon:yes stop_codon:yes gene_type:complete
MGEFRQKIEDDKKDFKLDKFDKNEAELKTFDENKPKMDGKVGQTLSSFGKPLIKGIQTQNAVSSLQQASNYFGSGQGSYESVAKGGTKSKTQHEFEKVAVGAGATSAAGQLGESAIKTGVTKIGVPLIMKGTGNVGHAVKATKAANVIGKAAGVAGDVAAVAQIGSTVADLAHEGKNEGFIAKETKTAQALDAGSAAVGVGGSIAGMAGASAGGIGAAMSAGGAALAGGAGLGGSVLAAGAALGPVGWAALGLMGAAAIFRKKGGDKYRLR